MKLRHVFPITLAGAAAGLALLSAPATPVASAETEKHSTSKTVDAGSTTATTVAPIPSGQQNVYVVEPGLPTGENPGEALYTRHCSTCHGANGEGSTQAPSLIGVGAAGTDFYISTGRMPMRVPSKQAPRAESLFTTEQKDAIVQYVAGGFGKGGPELPKVDTSKGDLVEGNELYANNCAQCHNSQGSGGALGQDYYAPNLYDSSPEDVAQAIRFGPGAMPKFGDATFSEEQVDSIALYVKHLQTADNPGGLTIGRLGPVAEGFVAWVVGLGGLLALTRWIGTRT